MSERSSYWCEHALLPDGAARGVRLVVEDGLITAVDRRTPLSHNDIRLPGIVLPGLANGHSHAFHRALRGRTHADGGNFWTWREVMYAVTRRLDPDTYFALARATFAEMVLAGYTCVGEFHYVHHDISGRSYGAPEMEHAVLAAAGEAGIRITLLDTCYLAGGLSAGGHLPLDETQRRFSDGSVQAWESRVAAIRTGRNARVGAAIHSVRAVPRPQLGAVAQAAQGVPLHVHLSEQPGENHTCQAFYGCTPTELLAFEGALGETTTAVHATHLSERDIHLLGDARATACFCPTTERDLADGIGPATELLAAGTRLALGSDQHAMIDPFEEIRGLEMHERLRTYERGRFATGTLLDAATGHGYAALGWPTGGRLAVGGLADLVVVRRDSRRTAGSRPDQIIYAATSADVTDVMVDGAWVVRGGLHRLGEVERQLLAALDAVQPRT